MRKPGFKRDSITIIIRVFITFTTETPFPHLKKLRLKKNEIVLGSLSSFVLLWLCNHRCFLFIFLPEFSLYILIWNDSIDKFANMGPPFNHVRTWRVEKKMKLCWDPSVVLFNHRCFLFIFLPEFSLYILIWNDSIDKFANMGPPFNHVRTWRVLVSWTHPYDFCWGLYSKYEHNWFQISIKQKWFMSTLFGTTQCTTLWG